MTKPEQGREVVSSRPLALEDTTNVSDHLPDACKRPKVFVTISQAVDLCQDIGTRVAALTPFPDFAIGLANGGTLPAIVASQIAGIDCEIIKVRRKSSRLKQRFGFLRHLAKASPMIARSKPLQFLKGRFDRRFNQLESTDFSLQALDVADRNIVIIDDCVDSGSTAAYVRDQLVVQGAASVRVAVISWGTKYNSLELHSLVPDIYLNRTIDFYPWSLESPEYEEFTKWIRSHGQTLWT